MSLMALNKTLTALLMSAVLLVSAGGCNDTQPKVIITGDSITAWSEAAFPKDQDVRATPGIDLKDGRTKHVKPAVADKPDVLVVELGINSAREVWNSDDLPSLEGILADTNSIDCVVWVTPTALSPSYYDNLGEGTLKERIAAFQASLKKRLAANPNVRLADFGAVEKASWYQDDHLHLNPTGQKAYAAFVLAAVDDCP